MGAESQGMILAAEGPDGVILATFGKGAKVESKFR
jgi:tRNA-binding EMAP/Myf-like protein